MNPSTRINRIACGGCDGRGLVDRALAMVGAGTPVVAPAIGAHDVCIASGTVAARCRAARWRWRPHPSRRDLRISRRHRRAVRGICRPVDNAERRHRCSEPRAVPGRGRSGSSTHRLCRTRADAMQFLPDVRAMAATADVFAYGLPDDARTVAMPGESRKRISAEHLLATTTVEDHRFEVMSGRLAALADARGHAA